MESIKISKTFLFSVLVASRQLALSLDRALHDDWEAFLNFYGSEEREIYSGVLNRILRTDGIDFGQTTEVCELEDLTLIRRVWAQVSFLVGKHVRLPRNDLMFAGVALRSGVQLIESTVRPVDSCIAGVRLRLSECEAVFEQRVTAAARRRAQEVDHFNSAHHIELVSIRDLVDMETW